MYHPIRKDSSRSCIFFSFQVAFARMLWHNRVQILTDFSRDSLTHLIINIVANIAHIMHIPRVHVGHLLLQFLHSQNCLVGGAFARVHLIQLVEVYFDLVFFYGGLGSGFFDRCGRVFLLRDLPVQGLNRIPDLLALLILYTSVTKES